MCQIYPVTVWINKQRMQIECSKDESILEALRRQGIPYYSDCGGRGSCGKCKIRLRSGTVAPGPEDRKSLSGTELEEGYRLACRVYPQGGVEIELMDYDERIETVITAKELAPFSPAKENWRQEYVVAIDLGTTTLALGLVDCKTGELIATRSVMNPQRRIGADVISRMKASNEGKGEQLQALIRLALLEGIEQLCMDASVPPERLRQITIAGNTTMIHLLMGYSCEELGRYPFQPVHIGSLQRGCAELFGETWRQRGSLEEANDCALAEVRVHILPGISAFVGGDIVAGLGVCGFDVSEKICLFIDLGTNGELAIGNRDRLLVSSTAAGPAFEGGNISIGIGSVPGAISKVSMREGTLYSETIGGLTPIGLCGTGVIELCSELLTNGIMDETGLLGGDYFESGFLLYQEKDKQLRFLQRDIRELQLAKAAICAGLELLINSYGCSYEGIDRVYLAGGFGYVLPIEKAVHIGLLPEQLKEKIIPIGNSSLAGAVRYALDAEFSSRLDRLSGLAQELHIANQEEFQELYIRYMNFPSGEAEDFT